MNLPTSTSPTGDGLHCSRLTVRESGRALKVAAAMLFAFALVAAMPQAASAGKCTDDLEQIGDYDDGCGRKQICSAESLECVAAGSATEAEKILLCHEPPGCPGNRRTISVSPCALGAHLAHHPDHVGECLECDGDEDCPEGEVCNTDTGFCVPPDGGCEDDSDCGGGQICVDGMCVDPPCTSDDDCPMGEICDLDTGMCVPAPCDADDDCPLGEICDLDTGECVPGCTSDDDCPMGEICDLETGHCVPGCSSDEECAEGEICEDGHCGPAECMIDEDCAFDESDMCVIGATCEDGRCEDVPLCDSECATCAGGVCDPMCGNPWEASTTGINIVDGLFDLRAAVELENCALCVCDVNNDGRITAVDALIIARNVVGLPAVLNCPSGI